MQPPKEFLHFPTEYRGASDQSRSVAQLHPLPKVEERRAASAAHILHGNYNCDVYYKGV